MDTQTLIQELLGTPYVYWDGHYWLRVHKEPFYSINDSNIDIDYVKSKGCNCSGFINILLRNKGIGIPDYNSDYPGGTFAYGIHFKWERIDENKDYPKYSLFLRPFVENSDEGHLGIIDEEGILYDCYPNYGVRKYSHWKQNFMFEFVCTELCEKLSE